MVRLIHHYPSFPLYLCLITGYNLFLDLVCFGCWWYLWNSFEAFFSSPPITKKMTKTTKTTTTKRQTKSLPRRRPRPSVDVKTKTKLSPSPPNDFDAALWKTCGDIVSYQNKLEAVRCTILFSPDCTINLLGVSWKLRNPNVVEHLISQLLCQLDEIDIPRQALYLRAKRKALVKVTEYLVEAWKIRFVATVTTKTTATKTKSKSKSAEMATTKRKTKAPSRSTITSSKRSKRLAAKARAKQWAEKTYGKK